MFSKRANGKVSKGKGSPPRSLIRTAPLAALGLIMLPQGTKAVGYPTRIAIGALVGITPPENVAPLENATPLEEATTPGAAVGHDMRIPAESVLWGQSEMPDEQEWTLAGSQIVAPTARRIQQEYNHAHYGPRLIDIRRLIEAASPIEEDASVEPMTKNERKKHIKELKAEVKNAQKYHREQVKIEKERKAKKKAGRAGECIKNMTYYSSRAKYHEMAQDVARLLNDGVSAKDMSCMDRNSECSDTEENFLKPVRNYFFKEVVKEDGVGGWYRYSCRSNYYAPVFAVHSEAWISEFKMRRYKAKYGRLSNPYMEGVLEEAQAETAALQMPDNTSQDIDALVG